MSVRTALAFVMVFALGGLAGGWSERIGHECPAYSAPVADICESEPLDFTPLDLPDSPLTPLGKSGGAVR